MSNTLSFEERLDRLAELAVRVGLGLRPGEEIIVGAPVESVPFVRRMTEHAYKAGAIQVTPIFADSANELTRFRFAPDAAFDYAPQWLIDGMTSAFRSKKALRLSVFGEDPALLRGQDPEKIARVNRARNIASREMLELLTAFTVNWSVVACATPAWARAVFPGLSEDAALERLWDAIFIASRVDGDDPVANWEKHNRALGKRTALLNQQRFHALHFRGPGTDLRVGLADDHRWLGAAQPTADGRICNPNIPTEEVFTTPHKDRVDGTVASSKPLYYRGTLIDGIQMRFAQGRAVEASARVGGEVLQKVLETDEGAARLGEVALVPHSSPISQTGLIFQSTLFDENAASHIALGKAYGVAISGGESMKPDELAARGANSSLIHIDWMIGSAEVSVDGIRADGTSEPLMSRGEWVTPDAAL